MSKKGGRAIFRLGLAAILCLGAAAMGRKSPENARTLRTWLVNEERSPVTQAAQCFLDAMAEGEPVGEAVYAFCQELAGVEGH